MSGNGMSNSEKFGRGSNLDENKVLPARLNASSPLEYRAFDAPWHAQLFALTVHLSESGRFSWQEWTTHLGAELHVSQKSASEYCSDTYYEAWLRALEKLLLRLNYSAQDELDRIRELWKQAYASTPHGQPVILDLDRRAPMIRTKQGSVR